MSTAADQILDAVQVRLETITQANGYAFTLRPALIARARLTPWAGSDTPAANYFAQGVEIQSRQYAREKRNLVVTVDIRTLTRDRPFVEAAAELGDAVEMALTRAAAVPGPNADPSFILEGGLGEVQIATVEYAIGEGQAPLCAALITANVLYTVSAGRPNSIITM